MSFPSSSLLSCSPLPEGFFAVHCRSANFAGISTFQGLAMDTTKPTLNSQLFKLNFRVIRGYGFYVTPILCVTSDNCLHFFGKNHD